MRDTDRLSDHAAARIDELQAEGIVLTPAEIVRLNALGWNVEQPEIRLALARGMPVSVGGVTLWPLTMRAYDWHCSAANYMPTVRLGKIALAYAMAHAYAEGPQLDRRGIAAVAHVIAWGAGLRCRMPELTEAMAQVVMQDEHERGVEDPNQEPVYVGEVSANISAITGLDPEQVEGRMSLGHALRIAHYTVEAQAAAEGNQATRAAYAKANQAMALYMMEIRESRKAVTDGTA